MKTLKKNITLKISLSLLFVFTNIQSFACDICQKKQPTALKNITHGTGPESNWDILIIWLALVVVALTLFFSIKFLVKPKENNINHIKNIILK